MVKLYVADISNLPDPGEHPEMLEQLSIERQHKIGKLRNKKNRKQSIGAGLLLKKVLALYQIESSSFAVSEHGKPQVEGLQFNLSHSGNLVICAVSDKPVGCDVEQLRNAPKNVAKRFFSERENEYLNQFCGEDYDNAFFRLWTMKESYVKMTGEGMRLPFESYEILVGELVKVFRGGKLQECYLSEARIQDYVISVWAKSSVPMEIIWEKLNSPTYL